MRTLNCVAHCRSLVAVLAILLPFLVTTEAGCASADNPTPTSSPTTPITRAGITYTPNQSVHATITPKFDEKDPPPQALTYGVTYDGGNGEQVTGNLYIPVPVKKAGTRAPSVIVLHGLGGKKEDVSLLCYAFANKGYVALAIDIAGHGDRPLYHGKQVAALSLEETHTVIGQTLADLHRAIDFLATRSEVDTTRIGFVGASLGGIIGGVFIADEPRIQSATLWSAGGDWGKLMTTSTHAFAQKYQKPTLTPAETIETTMTDVDPVTCIASYNRPLLFLYGDKDTVVPTNCIEELYAVAKEPKKRVVFPGGHIPDPFGMLTETTKWLETTLKPTKKVANR